MEQSARHTLLTNLYAGRVLSFAARSVVGIFLPIFLFEVFGEEVTPVIVFFLALHLAYGFLVAVGAKLLNHIGFRLSLLLGLAGTALFNVALYLLDRVAQPETLLFFAILAFLTGLAFRIFYWVPFHTEFGKYTDKKKRGAQVGLLVSILTLIGALSPVVGGFVTESFGYQTLFLISIGMVFLAGIPFSRMPKHDEVFSWSYRESFRQFFAKRNRRLVLASSMAGIDSVLGAVIWPLFIFILLSGDYLDVGLVSGFIVAATALFQIVLGRFLDQMPKSRLLRAGSLFSAVGWAIKIFITTASQVFLVGIYHNLAKSSISTSYSAFFYEIAADGEHYIDEYTVIREMAIQFGKVAALLGIGGLLFFVPLQWTFLIGVASAIFLSFALTDEQEGYDCVPDRSC